MSAPRPRFLFFRTVKSCFELSATPLPPARSDTCFSAFRCHFLPRGQVNRPRCPDLVTYAILAHSSSYVPPILIYCFPKGFPPHLLPIFPLHRTAPSCLPSKTFLSLLVFVFRRAVPLHSLRAPPSRDVSTFLWSSSFIKSCSAGLLGLVAFYASALRTTSLIH